MKSLQKEYFLIKIFFKDKIFGIKTKRYSWPQSLLPTILKFGKIYKDNKGSMNHMNKKGNQYVYEIIKNLINE